jgi:hypothetical protein
MKFKITLIGNDVFYWCKEITAPSIDIAISQAFEQALPVTIEMIINVEASVVTATSEALDREARMHEADRTESPL